MPLKVTTPLSPRGAAAGVPGIARKAATGASTWSIPVDPTVVLVDDVKALKQAVHDEMESIGCGAFQHRTVTILGLGNIADAVEILAIGYILTVYEDTDGVISPWEASFLTAAVFAGMLVGGLAGGVLGDVYGRKPILLTTLALNAAAAFLSALSPTIYWLILFRTLAGVGVGGVVSSLFALCLELVPVAQRGRYVTILCACWMLGSVLTAATAWLLLGYETGGPKPSWRAFAAVVGLPSLLCLVLTYAFVPESPHWLASHGRVAQVNMTLETIHRVQTSARSVAFAFRDASESNHSLQTTAHPTTRPQWCDATQRQRIARLFQPPQTTTTLLLMACASCLSFGSYGLSTWIAKLFQTVGLVNPFENAFLFAGANLPGNVVSVYLIDRMGRNELLSASFFAAATCTLLFAFNVDGGSTTLVVVASCLFNACTTAAWNAFGVLSAENFPLEVRTTGISLVNCSGRVGAIVAQFVNGFLVGPPPHIEALLLVVTSVMIAGGLASRSVPTLVGTTASDSASPTLHMRGGKRNMRVNSSDDGDDALDRQAGEATATHVDDTTSDEDIGSNSHHGHDEHDETRRCLRKTDRSSSS